MNNGGIIIRTECQCGHRHTFTGDDPRVDPATFTEFEKMKCAKCGRVGWPQFVTRSWSSGAEHAPYRGTFQSD